VRDPGRAPGLPLVIAVLDRLGALPWLPVLLHGFFLATILAFYRLAAREGSRRGAFAVSLALLASYSLTGMSLQVMADVPASCLLFLAGRSFVLAAPGSPRRYLTAGLLGGLAALTQAACVLIAIPAAVTVIVHRRRDLRSGWLWAGAFLFAALQGLWIVVRLTVLGSAGNHLARQWNLIDPHAGSAFFYLYSLASLLGIPGVLLLGVASAGAVRSARRDGAVLFWALLLAVFAIFFVFFYDFDAKRFLLYLVWPAGLLIAGVLSRIRSRAAFAAAAGLLIAGSSFPLPVEGKDGTWIGVWPLPPAYLQAPVTGRPSGSPVLRASGIRLRTFPPADLFRFSNLNRVWSARRAARSSPRPERLDPARVKADRGALFLFLDRSDGGGRHRTLSRLSNALLKPVKFVPAGWLEPWAAYLAVEPVGVIAPDYAIFRTRLAGLGGSWLLVTPGDGALRQRWEERAGQRPQRAGRVLRRGQARAKTIRRRLPKDGLVVLLPADDPARFYLPFLLETPELIVVEPAEEQALLDQIAAAPRLSVRRVAGAEIRELRVQGWRTAVVKFPEREIVDAAVGPP
jgi:dolichyl-phosphate-mannose-protein mannosyltransferase